jgi:hypothetical protein
LETRLREDEDLGRRIINLAEKLAKEKGIDTWEACTLVLMSTGQY